ncbi:MAG TPA: hypothetical protein VMU22_08305 [Rhizomicrobium sp.]|nr:hypothetical protein [Rhizomicrobium sp.]
MSVGLVLLLHILVLAALLSARVKVHDTAPRETILRLLPFLRSAPAPEAAPASIPSVVPMRRPVPPVMPAIAPPQPAEPSATVLAPALNGCTLENLANLPPDQRAACATRLNTAAGAAQAKARAGLNQPTRSKSAETWAQAIVKRNTPAKVDCTKIETEALGVQENVKSTMLMIDLGCAVRHLANGESPLK